MKYTTSSTFFHEHYRQNPPTLSKSTLFSYIIEINKAILIQAAAADVENRFKHNIRNNLHSKKKKKTSWTSIALVEAYQSLLVSYIYRYAIVKIYTKY
jgi:hypothetical protein